MHRRVGAEQGRLTALIGCPQPEIGERFNQSPVEMNAPAAGHDHRGRGKVMLPHPKAHLIDLRVVYIDENASSQRHAGSASLTAAGSRVRADINLLAVSGVSFELDREPGQFLSPVPRTPRSG